MVCPDAALDVAGGGGEDVRSGDGRPSELLEEGGREGGKGTPQKATTRAGESDPELGREAARNEGQNEGQNEGRNESSRSGADRLTVLSLSDAMESSAPRTSSTSETELMRPPSRKT